jgi:hypothetical protein
LCIKTKYYLRKKKLSQNAYTSYGNINYITYFDYAGAKGAMENPLWSHLMYVWRFKYKMIGLES